jgi:hypothetical protein
MGRHRIRQRAVVLVGCAATIAVLSTGCDHATVGAGCGGGFARSDTHVLICKAGRWQNWMTFRDYLLMLQRVQASQPTAGGAPQAASSGGPSAAALAPEVTVNPSTLDLPPGSTTLTVSGTNLRPDALVQIAQANQPANSPVGANVLADVKVSSSGVLGPTPVIVVSVGKALHCAVTPDVDRCFLQVSYFERAEPVATFPLTFTDSLRSS